MSQEKENELSICLKQMQGFQALFLAYFDSDNEIEFQNLQNYFDENKILESKQDFIAMLCFISKFTKNHHRSSAFYDKLHKVLLHFQQIYQKYCTNIDIFNIFKKNKLILYILFKEKIILPDSEIYSIISSDSYKNRNYPQYFQKEFQSISNEKFDIPDDYEQKRLIGENDDFLCSLIRKDDIDEFIKKTERQNINLSSKIKSSIYETNSFLIGKEPTFIDYALFFGSIQIVQYMICRKVGFTEESWLYCVHSKNYDLVHLLEEKNANDSYKECLLESIKCHHNEIADYILNNKIEGNDNDDDLKKKMMQQAICSHNYKFIPNDYHFLTGCCEPIVLLTKERYYKLIHTLLTMKVGPGTLCSCLTGTFGEDKVSNLYYAVKNHDVEMIKLLMKANSTFNAYSESTITRHIENKEVEGDKSTFTDSKTAPYLAVEKGYYDIIKLFLADKNVFFNEESMISYSHESYTGNNDDKFTKMPLHLAIEKGDDKMLELLLSYPQIDVNIECKIVKDFANPFQYNLHTIEKKAPLHIAIEKENVNAVRLLLSQKTINVNKKYTFKLDKKLDGYDYDEDNQGNEEEEQPGDNERDKKQTIKKTALHMAVEKGNIEIVKLLLNHDKIDVNSRMKYKLIKRLLKIDLQKTALQIAIQNKNVEIVKLLLEQPSISINERVPYKLDREAKGAKCYDDDGNEIPNEDTNNERRHDDCLKTPLHVAIQTGCIEIIKLLLKNRSINVNIPDGQGKLPIDYTDNPEIKALFPKT